MVVLGGWRVVVVVGERDGGLRLGREETWKKESTEGADGHFGGW